MRQTLIFALVICFSPFQQAYAECENQKDQNLGFQPGAITLVDLDLYDKPPTYSIIKGRVTYGRKLRTLRRDTCLQKIEERIVGIVQKWWLIQYKSGQTLTQGWIIVGTKRGQEFEYNLRGELE